MRRFQANRWQRNIAQNRNRVLSARDPSFRQDPIVPFPRTAEGRGHLFGRTHLTHAETGPFTRRLDDQRQPEALQCLLRIWLVHQDHVRRSGQSLRLPQLFGAQFIHADRTGRHAAAGIGDPGQLQCALNDAVLAAAAMQRDKRAVTSQRWQPREKIRLHVDSDRRHPRTAQRLEDGGTAAERNLPLP